MAQSILNFTVESTDERLTPRTGEVVFREFLKAFGVTDFVINIFLYLKVT